ncbi:hypothetical protein [Candidatus Thiothrix anitrata]|uniref:Lipoprotein n=1 Tax=Candidatus Thiothrix anitrata TaxID=2823902 RepID=A0ABX7X2E5_9GAMM|nr:hypothetical protein [Candidatus Thiothrix anitrata]QTR49442.1 hypothetical protein J8380_14515 [Candidatus Thiothrix anitrata]
MKIPLILGIVAAFLSACNPAKRDVVPQSPLSSTTATPVVATSLLINAKHQIRTTVYVVDDVVMVQMQNGTRQRLTGINPALYPDFQSVFFRIQDNNRDGFNEIAVLAGVSFGATERCYDVFHYNFKRGMFERRWEDFYCTSR